MLNTADPDLYYILCIRNYLIESAINVRAEDFFFFFFTYRYQITRVNFHPIAEQVQIENAK